jgi:hypothetical protein
MIEDYFVTKRGYSIKLFPNGHLPTWGVLQILTQHLFSTRDHQAVQAFNRLYRKHIYPTDQRFPSYRTLYLISKQPFSHNQLSRLDKLIGKPAQPELGLETFALDPALSSLFSRIQSTMESQTKALSDAQFLINERQKAINALTMLNKEIQDMPIWKVVLKQMRRRLKGRPTK